MSDTKEMSRLLSLVYKNIEEAHAQPDIWPNNMAQTYTAITEIGIQHYGTVGENVPRRVIEAQARAMAELTFLYSEQAYESDDLAFFDSGDKDRFENAVDEPGDHPQLDRECIEITVGPDYERVPPRVLATVREHGLGLRPGLGGRIGQPAHFVLIVT